MYLLIRFSKLGPAKFFSHLDTTRVFLRTLKRINLTLAYSQGFNPHPKIVFASPLPIFYTSESEYLTVLIEPIKSSAELILSESIKESNAFTLMDKIRISLNENLPTGFKVLYVKGVKIKLSLPSYVDALSYKILIQNKANANSRTYKTPNAIIKALEKYFSKKTRSVVKKTKKKDEVPIKLSEAIINKKIANTKPVDLFNFEKTKLAYNSQYSKNSELPFVTFSITLLNNTLSPKSLIEDFIKVSKLNLEFEIFRTGIYNLKKKKLIALDDIDEILL